MAEDRDGMEIYNGLPFGLFEVLNLTNVVSIKKEEEGIPWRSSG